MMVVRQMHTTITLTELLAGIISLNDDYNCEVSGLALDSRYVKQGDVFFALTGASTHGKTYIDAAVDAGAVAIVMEVESDADPLPVSWYTHQNNQLPLIAIHNLRAQLAAIANSYYNNPSLSLTLTGVTGTNGKTSITSFLAQVLSEKNKCGLIGTLGTGIYPDIVPGIHTTPDIFSLYKTLATFNEQGVNKVMMEVSSHALQQERIAGLNFTTAIFTNLSHEHLDYHQTMSQYLAAKLKLFQVDELKHAIVNIDDLSSHEVLASIAAEVNVLTYSVTKYKQANIFADRLIMEDKGISFTLHTPKGECEINTRLQGKFNISNLLAVVAVLVNEDYSMPEIKSRLEGVSAIAGRMEKVTSGNMPCFIIDYAHTPDALELVLQSLRKQYKGSLWCVFGCGGDRDQDKRARMGAIAEIYADHIVLTNDNPRNEPAEQIVSQILQGIEAKDKVTIEYDRQTAIHYAFNTSTNDDVILVAGKGHENYQITGDRRTHFSDRECIEKIIQQGHLI